MIATSLDPIVATVQGLPTAADGGLCIEPGGAIVGQIMGWPITAAGKIATDVTGPVARHANGRPLDANGRIVIAAAAGSFDGGYEKTVTGALATTPV